MYEKFDRVVVRLSVITLVAAALIIGAGYLGYGASPATLAGTLLLTLLFFGLAELESDNDFMRRIWYGPLLATLVLAYGAIRFWNDGEVQTVGGIVGFVGIVNLFLRPVYRLLFGLVENAVQIGREIQQERKEGS